MPIEIPYTFIAGTKAKASEVNANFEAMKNFVDTLEVNSAELEADITLLQTNKADLNGSTSEIFRMADAIGQYDGINLRTLNKLTSNSKAVINGFRVSKQSNTAVNATAGSCYDSNLAELIQSSTSLTKDQPGMSANAKYYVYVTADRESGECQLVISLSNATPELPSGYELYRRLATISTDSNGYISEVNNDAYEDYNQKLGGNGWCQLPNGLIIQWGSTTLTKINQENTVPLPRAFPNSFYAVVGSSNYVEASTNWDRGLVGVRKSGLDKVIVKIGRQNVGDHATTTVYYIAIGR